MGLCEKSQSQIFMRKMRFYTNVAYNYGNTIFYRGIEDGKRVSRKIPAKPVIFIPSNIDSKYKTVLGRNVSRIDFDSPDDLEMFIQENSQVENFEYFGNLGFNYCLIADEFPEQIEYDFDSLVIDYIDIEVASDNGFPTPELANEEVTAITIKHKEKYYVYGCGPYKPEKDDVVYQKCDDERDLLLTFLNDWQRFYPDIVSGWSISTFDVPYLINRITKILGDGEARRLSPWNRFSSRTINRLGKQERVPELVGISILDYLELYKKFAPKANQESYKLDYIASVELGEKKVDYSEYRGLQDLYKKNYQKFITYNIQDVALVQKLESKMKLIEGAIVLAYDAHCNFADTFNQTRMWDQIIFCDLKQKNIVVPQKKEIHKEQGYVGAFVKDPQIGLHKWVVSFDLDALYPSIIQQWNLSPETLIPICNEDITIQNLLDETIDLSEYKKKNQSIAASGFAFKRDFQGFLPKIIERMYKDRLRYKKLMKEKKKELELIKEEKMRRGM